ncbi:hypothetical protein [Streptomyces tubercidicus]|uniref:hypothetical protein n=1 Tax=Streptomyces tubercidicus TaxID=47759 RepID=UPI0036CA49FC
MGEFVSVDPERVRKLANRLKDLEEALARHGSSIRKKFREWDGDLDVSLIGKQTHAVGDDARDMAKRADVARNLEEHGEDAALCTPGGNLVSIPWDMKDVRAQSAKEAKQEAQTLKTALDDLQQIKLAPPGSGLKLIDPHSKDGSRADIKAIARSLLDHKDDPVYLAAFAEAGGIRQAARLGHVLHQQDGTHGGKVLSDESTKLIGQYARGVNHIFHLPKTGKNALHPDSLKSLTHPPGGDMWSVGTLFKYGPKGDKWDSKVLSLVGGAMLDWRRKQKTMRPSYSSPTPPYSAGGYVGKDDGGWYHALGLDPDYLSNSGDENDKIVAGIRANDPALAVISRLGQNAGASRDLLGDDSVASKRYASDLLDFRWQTPGPELQDDSEGPRSVLTLAATDRSPEHRDQSGRAAANILVAAPKMKDVFDARNDFEKEQYTNYPKGTAVALAGITGTWARDLGGTSTSAGPKANGYSDGHLVINQKTIDKVMQLFVKDNSAAASQFDAALDRQIAAAAADPKHRDADLYRLGNAAGLFTNAKTHVGYSTAMEKDEQAKRNLFWANTVAGLVGGLPGPESEGTETLARGLLWGQMLLGGGRAALTDAFDVGHADRQEAVNKEQARNAHMGFAPSIAEGLIRSGTVEAPQRRDWYDPKTKTVKPSAHNDDSFNSWWLEAFDKKPVKNARESFQNGFTDDPTRSFDGK